MFVPLKAKNPFPSSHLKGGWKQRNLVEVGLGLEKVCCLAGTPPPGPNSLKQRPAAYLTVFWFPHNSRPAQETDIFGPFLGLFGPFWVVFGPKNRELRESIGCQAVLVVGN